MNRLELLEEMHDMAIHNKYCYSEDMLMNTPKEEYIDEWNKENEKLELIQELINEEKANNFQLYTSVYNLKNEIGISHDMELAYLKDERKGISCYLMADEVNEENIEYILVFTLHKKDEFEDEFENIYTKDISKEKFSNRETLKDEMKKELDIFGKFIELDRKTDRFYSKYYEDIETEELE